MERSNLRHKSDRPEAVDPTSRDNSQAIHLSDPSHSSTLRRSDLFSELSHSEMEDVLGHALRQRWEVGQTVFSQGGIANKCYLVERGRIRLYQLTSGGHEVLIRFVTQGEFVGFAAVAQLSGFSVNAIVTQPTDTLAWTGDCMRKLMLKYPRLGLNAFTAAVGNMVRYENRCPGLCCDPVETRIGNALEELANCIGERTGESCRIDGGVLEKDIAQMAGASVGSVSRLLARWRRDGYIEGGRGKLIVRYSGDRLKLPSPRA